MSGGYRRGPDWLSIAVVVAILLVAAGSATLGAELLDESSTPTPWPFVSAGVVLSAPTRAATPTRFPSPTPAPTSTRAPSPTGLPTSVPTPTPTETSVTAPSSAVIDESGKSVVQVKAAGGAGSAFRVEAVGAPAFVTSSSVVGNATKVTLVAPNGSQHSGTVSRRVTAVGLALVTAADLSAIPALKLASDSPEAGDPLFVLGYKTGAKFPGPPASASGVMSGRRVVGAVEYLQTSAAIGAGVSGGPVLTAAGRVLGVAAPGLKDQKGAAVQGYFAIPSGLLQAFLKSTG